MPTPETIIYNKRGPVAEIKLNRPHIHNAFNTAMRDGLYQALEAARDDSDIGSILLSGIGKSFCAGADLTEFGTAPSVVAARDARWSRDLWGLFLDLDKPLDSRHPWPLHRLRIGNGPPLRPSPCVHRRLLQNA